MQCLDALFHSVLQRGKQLGCGGGGGGTQVGDEVSDGEVRLVSDRSDYWNCRAGDCSGEDLSIKRGKVLGRATTTGDNNCIHSLHAIEMKNA